MILGLPVKIAKTKGGGSSKLRQEVENSNPAVIADLMRKITRHQLLSSPTPVTQNYYTLARAINKPYSVVSLTRSS